MRPDPAFRARRDSVRTCAIARVHVRERALRVRPRERSRVRRAFAPPGF
jgi:hypothetical protein